MKSAMLALRPTPQRKKYFDLNREFPGSWQRRKIINVPFPTPKMSRTRKYFLSRICQMSDENHRKLPVPLESEVRCLFQRPGELEAFILTKIKHMYCSLPLGVDTSNSMLKSMSSRAGIQPKLTNRGANLRKQCFEFFFFS